MLLQFINAEKRLKIFIDSPVQAGVRLIQYIFIIANGHLVITMKCHGFVSLRVCPKGVRGCGDGLGCPTSAQDMGFMGGSDAAVHRIRHGS